MKNNNNLIRKIAIFAVLTISILGKSFGQIVFFIDMKKEKLTSYLSTRPEPNRDRGCALRIIILNEQGNKDTLDIPGCSRYEVNINEYGTVLTTYSWPFYYYSTDCALEDYIVPSNDDAE